MALSPPVSAAARHGVLGGGKRLRPILCVSAYAACKGEAPPAVFDLAADAPAERSGKMISISRLRARERGGGKPERLSGSIAMIRFSSGTTGQARGVMLSTKAILARAKTFCSAFSLTSDSRMLHLLSAELATPPLLGCLWKGATLVFEDASRMESIARVIRLHGITHIHASPLFYGLKASSGVG